jgi:hypothetical protein
LRRVYTTVFNLSKHGLRPEEIAKLTLKNIDLAEGLASFPGDYSCETTKTVSEAVQLIEQRFDYICDVDGMKLSRKRK